MTRDRLLAPVVALIAAAWCETAAAAAPHLVTDINAQYITVSSYPTDFADQGAWSFMDANDGIDGFQPWISNGTASGTFLWGHVSAPGTGVTGLQPIRAGALSYILYQDPLSQATTIWVTDGTKPGSHPLTALSAASAGVNAGFIGSIGNSAALTFFNLATSARDLWATDGTDIGTRRIQSASGAAFGVEASVAVNGKLYFVSSQVPGRVEIWVSDGTPAGTALLAQVPNSIQDPLVSPTLVSLGSYLLFNATTSDAGRELWRLDLTTGAVSQVADIASGGASGLPSGNLWRAGSVVLFPASVTGDANTTLWRTDGTPAGTFSIGSPAPTTSILPAVFGGAASPRAVFIATTPSGSQLWGTDGSMSGTQLLSSVVGGLTVNEVGGKWFFWNSAAAPIALWTTDGTAAGTHVLAGLPSISAPPQLAGTSSTLYLRITNGYSLSGQVVGYDMATAASTVLTNYSATTQPQFLIGVFAYAQGRLYFDNEDPVHGRELWSSDGTAAGTLLLKNIAPETQTQSSSPANFASFANRLYFTADDGISGTEVWSSDGTAGRTKQLLDINPGGAGSGPSDLFVANGVLYFFAYDRTGTAFLWRSDGTAAGTQRVTAVAPRPAPTRLTGCDSRGVAAGGFAYFAGYDAVNGLQLWRTNGTAVGTVRITTVLPPASLSLCNLAAFNNHLYFDGTSDLWVSDGTPTGTMPVVGANSVPASPSPQWLTSFRGSLFYVAYDAARGSRLWSTDGTATGTNTIITLSGSSAATLQAGLGGKLAITAAGTSGLELWASDGTTAGTTRLAGNLQSTSVFLNGGIGFYSGLPLGGNSFDSEPWVSDGTVNGTHLLLEINSQSGSAPDTFVNFNGITYFEATSTSGGRQLWRTNGSASATKAVATTTMGPFQLAVGQNLYFIYNDGTTGDELWVLNNERPVAADDNGGSVTAGASISIGVLSNDLDPDGALNVGSVTIGTKPMHGSASVSSAGAIMYTATAGYAGPDSLTYTVADDQGYVSAPATVTVNVAGPPPAPKSGGGGSMSTDLVMLLTLAALARVWSKTLLDVRPKRSAV